MTKSTITRERLEQLADNNTICKVSWDERIELAQIALAAMDSEPVILYRQVNPANGMKTYWAELDPEEFRHLKQYTDENAEFMTLYRHAQPAPERDQVRIAHSEWSQATFGNVGPVGPLKHLSKEALEAADQPGDLSEWANMQFLMWDAQRRAGITDEQITQAMFDKLAVNKRRSWPEPKDGEPRLHIKEQPAPVVPDDVLDALRKVARIRLDLNDFDGDRRGIADCLGDAEEALIDVVNRCAAMLAAAPQLPGSEPATVPSKWIPVSERMPDENAEQQVLACFKGGDISTLYYFEGRWDDAYGIVPIRQDVTHWMPLPTAPQEVKGE
nr:DUF550 domain-containing protein [Klebsiella variicola]